jgi:hypothetical protein
MKTAQPFPETLRSEKNQPVGFQEKRARQTETTFFRLQYMPDRRLCKQKVFDRIRGSGS